MSIRNGSSTAGELYTFSGSASIFKECFYLTILVGVVLPVLLKYSLRSQISQNVFHSISFQALYSYCWEIVYSVHSDSYLTIISLRLLSYFNMSNYSLRNLSGSSKAQSRPLGLENTLYACYQNATLQGLSTLLSLSRYLDNLPSKIDSNTLTSALSQLSFEINNPIAGKLGFRTPAVQLQNLSPELTPFQQSDAQEYLSALLDKVDKEHVSSLKSNSHNNRLDSAKSAEERNQILGSLKLRNSNPLVGYTSQTRSCETCGFSDKSRLIPFLCMTLQIPKGSPANVSLSHLIEHHFQSEQLEDVTCTKCALQKYANSLEETPNNSSQRVKLIQEISNPGTNADAYAQRLENLSEQYKVESWLKENPCVSNKKQVTKLVHLPPALCFHINRSVWDLYGGSQKLGNGIYVPKFLDFSSPTSKYRSIPTCEQIFSLPEHFSSGFYHLKAVVEHFGSDKSGHYTCYKSWKPPNVNGNPSKQPESWYLMDDAKVTPVTATRVETKPSRAFLVFYEEVTPEQLNLEEKHLNGKRPRGTEDSKSDHENQPSRKKMTLKKHGQKLLHL